jgi:hypothetical protein
MPLGVRRQGMTNPRLLPRCSGRTMVRRTHGTHPLGAGSGAALSPDGRTHRGVRVAAERADLITHRVWSQPSVLDETKYVDYQGFHVPAVA